MEFDIEEVKTLLRLALEDIEANRLHTAKVYTSDAFIILGGYIEQRRKQQLQNLALEPKSKKIVIGDW